jgi:hypothetical protein
MNESRNPNSVVWQMMLNLLCFKDAESPITFLFCFWLCLLFCRLLWSGLGELVLVMERDPSCSIDNLYGECESQFLETIGAKLPKE